MSGILVTEVEKMKPDSDNRKTERPSETAESQSESAEKRAERKERNEAVQGFGNLTEGIKEHRRKQHESGKSGITGMGDANGTFGSAKDILGKRAQKNKEEKSEKSEKPRENFVTTSVKAELLKGSNDGSGENKIAKSEYKNENLEKDAADSAAYRAELLDKASATLLKGAEERFGKKNVDILNIAEGDVGAATSALLLGPDICKLMGPEQTSLTGKKLVVFGIAPMFGAAEEAQKKISEDNLQKTIHDGSGNFIGGTAIGAVLEKAHPAILLAALGGGIAAITNDQLNSPEHMQRNAELGQMNGRLANCSNADLLQFADRTKAMLGPEYYKAAFDLATGGAGLPEGEAVAAGVKEETKPLLEQIEPAKVLEGLKNLGKDAWEALGNFCGGSEMLTTEGVKTRSPKISNEAEDNILQMAQHRADRANDWQRELSREVESSKGEATGFRGDHDFHSPVNEKGRRKSHIDENGDLRPADPAGIYKGRKVSVAEHIEAQACRRAKEHSPYTSFATKDAVIAKYGGKGIELDLDGLRNAITKGEFGVKIHEHEDVVQSIRNSYFKRYEKIKLLEFVEKDKEILVEGIIPKQFIKIRE